MYKPLDDASRLNRLKHRAGGNNGNVLEFPLSFKFDMLLKNKKTGFPLGQESQEKSGSLLEG